MFYYHIFKLFDFSKTNECVKPVSLQYIIRVNDLNDNDPRFVVTTPAVTLNEGSGAGTPVDWVWTVSDADSTPSNSYSFEGNTSFK